MADCDGTSEGYAMGHNVTNVMYDPSGVFYDAETFEKWNPSKVEGKQWSKLFDIMCMAEDYVFYQSRKHHHVYFKILKVTDKDEYTRWRLYRRACINLLSALVNDGYIDEEIINEYGSVVGERNIRRFIAIKKKNKSNSTVYYG